LAVGTTSVEVALE